MRLKVTLFSFFLIFTFETYSQDLNINMIVGNHLSFYDLKGPGEYVNLHSVTFKTNGNCNIVITNRQLPNGLSLNDSESHGEWRVYKGKIRINHDNITYIVNSIDGKFLTNVIMNVDEKYTKSYLLFYSNINKVDISVEDVLRKYVIDKISNWQIKGEFEKMSVYQERVNVKTRAVQIKKIEALALDSLKKDFIQNINLNDITLSRYDAESEVFVINSELGQFPINVSIDYAKEFKKNVGNLIWGNEEVLLIDNKFTLSHFEVCYQIYDEKSFPRDCFYYDIENNSTYSSTEIDYNFPEIEFEVSNEATLSKPFKVENKKISLGSKVDVNFPSNPKVENRYALIIGNEDYTSYQSGLSTEQNVDFAENDANTFKQYALKTLGVNEENLYYLKNATAGQMKQKIALVSKIINQIGSDAELIFYYAGHGYPDELTKVPYLIPVDISASDLSSAINLSDLYKTFSESNAKKITVFLDACFTGGARSLGLVASRGIKISPKEDNLNGNLVVFSASSDKQSSLPYYEQAHGMFTYFLLDKLQSSRGKCTYSELFDYVNQKVSLNALKINEKEQNPKVNTSQNVNEDWGNWKF